jgi:hypothetical protein
VRPPIWAEFRARLRCPPGGADLVECFDRGLDCLAGRALLAGPPPDHAEREQRARPAERVADLRVLLHRSLEEGLGLGDAAARGRNEPTAACHVCEHPPPPDAGGVFLPPVEQFARVIGPAELEDRLHVIRTPPVGGGLSVTEGSACLLRRRKVRDGVPRIPAP